MNIHGVILCRIRIHFGVYALDMSYYGINLASRIGFEPTASAFAGLRSIPLSYRDICYRSVIFLYILAIVRQNLPERECLTGELTQDSALCLDLSIGL